MIVRTTQLGERDRRRIYARPDGALVAPQDLRELRGGAAWCLTRAPIYVPASLIDTAPTDVREAYFEALLQAA